MKITLAGRRIKIFSKELLDYKKNEGPKLREPGKQAVNIKRVQNQRAFSHDKCKFCGDPIIWEKRAKYWVPLNKDSKVTHIYICAGKK